MTQEGQATEDIVADPQVDLPADHLQEAHHTIDAQEDTEGPHHITSTQLPSQDAMQHQTAWKKAKTDIQHLFQQNVSHFPPTGTQKIQMTQHQRSV